MSTCKRLDLQTLGSQPTMPKNLSNHWVRVCMSQVHLMGGTIPEKVSDSILGFSPTNERGVPNFSYKLAEIFWTFPNEFTMIRRRYRLKIVKVRN